MIYVLSSIVTSLYKLYTYQYLLERIKEEGDQTKELIRIPSPDGEGGIAQRQWTRSMGGATGDAKTQDDQRHNLLVVNNMVNLHRVTVDQLRGTFCQIRQRMHKEERQVAQRSLKMLLRDNSSRKPLKPANRPKHSSLQEETHWQSKKMALNCLWDLPSSVRTERLNGLLSPSFIFSNEDYGASTPTMTTFLSKRHS